MGQQTVVGMFDHAEDAQKAVRELQAAGFSRDTYDVVTRPSGSAGRDSDHYNASGTMVEGAADSIGRSMEGDRNDPTHRDSDHYNKSGTMVEGAADAVGRAFEPNRTDSNYRDSNHYNASGTMAEGAADAAGRAGEKSGNAISRFFDNLFGNDKESSSRYSEVASRSCSIVTVHCNSAENARRAADILDDCGAVDVDKRAAEYGYGRTDAATSGARGAGETQSVNVIREDLNVGKREVETGGARLRSRIVERPVEENLRLREERVFVDREPVNRPATEADFEAFKEGTIELRETSEVPVVNKEARVVEEVRLGKEAQERTETIRDTVRNTEVDVERIEGNDLNRTDRNDLNRTDRTDRNTPGSSPSDRSDDIRNR